MTMTMMMGDDDDVDVVVVVVVVMSMAFPGFAVIGLPLVSQRLWSSAGIEQCGRGIALVHPSFVSAGGASALCTSQPNAVPPGTRSATPPTPTSTIDSYRGSEYLQIRLFRVSMR